MPSTPVSLSRKMPWYSTTDQQHPAFHLQIVNNPMKGVYMAASTNGDDADDADGSIANNNNEDDDDGDDGNDGAAKVGNGHAVGAGEEKGVNGNVSCVNGGVNCVNGVGIAASPKTMVKRVMRKQESCPISQVCFFLVFLFGILYVYCLPLFSYLTVPNGIDTLPSLLIQSVSKPEASSYSCQTFFV